MTMESTLDMQQIRLRSIRFLCDRELTYMGYNRIFGYYKVLFRMGMGFDVGIVMTALTGVLSYQKY